jgi:hypothetical protein
MMRIMDELNNYRMATYFQKASDACTWFKNEVPDMDSTNFCKSISTTTNKTAERTSKRVEDRSSRLISCR